MKRHFAYMTMGVAGLCVLAQQPVQVGRASYAAYPPPYKASTAEHAGFNASMMLTRKIYADETGPDGKQRPIPTNDWWTDVLNNQFSGALWSYPAMLTTSSEGVTVAYPTHWNENGTEVKADSWLRVQGVKFTAAEARATDWHDWDVEIVLPSAVGDGTIMATLAHGSPFSWFEFDGVSPEIMFSASPELVTRDGDGAVVRVGADHYGLYFPSATSFSVSDGIIRLDGAGWLSVGLLGGEDDYETFKPYATSVVRSTRVEWLYDERSSLLSTSWDVKADNLRSPGSPAPVMQGFLPHAYKHAVSATISWNGSTYLTPRGAMKMATAADGHFGYAYRFAGMLPFYAAPRDGDIAEHGYDAEVMRDLIERYADGGAFGADTYWGGKGLTQMALNMTFAKQTGNAELYDRSKAKLRSALVDWLTYAPGEENRFFSYYPRWGGMLGFDVSYDSDAFNDHHFHYGYFIYAAALLCLEDEDFAQGYGEMLEMIAKDYANLDRSDARFPFLRTLDPWAGHSYAGGLGDHGNDNGNGQESSSESMQGWGGVYLLGVALGDREMRDAGIFGWLTESRATAEYWFDRDHIHQGRDHNYDYTLYQSPYNTNLTSKGIGWWTWFSGDALWMHSIQWMPVSPCLNYLSEDLDFVKWDYETMRSSTAYSWFEPSGNEAPLADQSVGNVVLCYMERYDPAGAAAIFDEALQRGMGIARGIDTGHISYYVIHSHLTYGDIDFGVSADCPSANAYRRLDGSMTYMVYNPDAGERKVTFYRDGVVERIVTAPAGVLSVFAEEAAPASLSIATATGFVVPPGSDIALKAVCLDQYGASADVSDASWSVDGVAAISPDGMLSVPASAQKGSVVQVRVEMAGMVATAEFIVNDLPVPISAEIEGIPDFVETGTTCKLSVKTVDQYGVESFPEAEWTVRASDGSVVDADNGEIAFTSAGVYGIEADCGSIKATGKLVVLPPLPNVATGCRATSSSEENAGTLTANAVDGDHSTRWGSRHTDSEWLMVDLGSDHRIASVTIDWEAAYGADYDIEIATEATPDKWDVVFAQRGLSSPGIIRHSIAATGRYVRINGLRRATSYGYSILEVEVGAVAADALPTEIAGIEIAAPEVMMEGEAVAVGACAFNLGGEPVSVGAVEWSSEPEGVFTDGYFTPLHYGIYTLSARKGALTAKRTVLVEESVKLASLTVTPARLTMLTGDTAQLSIEGKNQFGGLHPLDEGRISAKILDVEGREVDAAVAVLDMTCGVFKANLRGDYVIDLAGMAQVEVAVRDVAEANLAAGKAARASSGQGGNVASNVTDLDPATRWESAHVDGEWIAIDLDGAFVLDRVVLNWEGAYAEKYDLAITLDGERWFTVFSTSEGQGGTETITLPDVPAASVKLTCLRRATVWGSSLYEIEVYGKRRFDDENPQKAPRINDVEITAGNGSIGVSAAFSHVAGSVFSTINVYGSSGSLRRSATGTGEAVSISFDGLKSDSYVVEILAEDIFGNVAVETRSVDVEYCIDGINLALGKPAEATSAENESLSAQRAVDGDISTRWGSDFADGEAIMVDLVDTYTINNVCIRWNSPAFASEYSVEISADGLGWEMVHSRTGWNGGTDDATFAPVDARYVRVTGHRRATPYGTSIDELEVYGTAVVSGADDVYAAGDDEREMVFNLQGMRIAQGMPGQTVIICRGSRARKKVVR